MDIPVGSVVGYADHFIIRQKKFNSRSSQWEKSFSQLRGKVTSKVDDDTYTVVWDLSGNLKSISYLKRSPITRGLVNYDPDTDTMRIDESGYYLVVYP
jgi:hypothetical protein